MVTRYKPLELLRDLYMDLLIIEREYEVLLIKALSVNTFGSRASTSLYNKVKKNDK